MTATLSRRTRADETPPRRGWSRRTVVLAAVAVAVLAVVAVWVVAFSPLLGVRTVTVRGESLVAQRSILAAADIARGTPLARLDTDAVAHRVEKLDGVYSADVSTSYPSTVVITVIERMPIGIVKVDGGFALVDRTGAQYRTVERAPKNLPLFVVASGTAGREAGRAVAAVASALPAALRARIASIQALDADSVTLLLTNGRVVSWGSATRNGDKARILPALLQRLNHDGGHRIDVTDPMRPFTS